MRSILVLLALLCACSEKGPFIDDDGDGTLAQNDCDDDNADINPDQREACNGIDDNCDGRIDEGITSHTWYTDADGDAYGDQEKSEKSCFQPVGTVPDGSDCDDDDAEIHPKQTEACDGVDNDCNDEIDELDQDGDGYVALDCGGGDCNDDNSRIYPGARERWYDGEDQNCDGLSDFDADYDGYDSLDRGEGDDCDDASDDINPGEQETCNDGIDNNCDGDATGCTILGDLGTADANAVLRGLAGDMAGILQPSLPGDLDQDGNDDLIIGATGYAGAGDRAGAAYIVLGPVSGEMSLSDAAGRLDGVAAGDRAGTGVAIIGDTNDDDYPDVLIASPNADNNATDSGTVYLGLGPVTGQMALDELDGLLLGVSARDHVSVVSAAGDISDDGLSDLMIAAPDNDEGGNGAGIVYLVLGAYSGQATLDNASYMTLVGSSAADGVGSALSPGFDIDGDDVDDVMVGAPGADSDGSNRGVVYVIAWPEAGTTDIASAAECRYTGAADGDKLGSAVSSAGDMNGDGTADMLFGAPNADNTAVDAGAVYYFTGAWRVGTEAATSASAVILGAAEGDKLGSALAGPGDINGDDFTDVLIGVPGDDTTDADAGAVYVFYGPLVGTYTVDMADARIYGDALHDNLGGDGLARAGDLNGDGIPDVAASMTLNDGAGDNAGSILIFNGAGL